MVIARRRRRRSCIGLSALETCAYPGGPLSSPIIGILTHSTGFPVRLLGPDSRSRRVHSLRYCIPSGEVESPISREEIPSVRYGPSREHREIPGPAAVRRDCSWKQDSRRLACLAGSGLDCSFRVSSVIFTVLKVERRQCHDRSRRRNDESSHTTDIIDVLLFFTMRIVILYVCVCVCLFKGLIVMQTVLLLEYGTFRQGLLCCCARKLFGRCPTRTASPSEADAAHRG